MIKVLHKKGDFDALLRYDLSLEISSDKVFNPSPIILACSDNFVEEERISSKSSVISAGVKTESLHFGHSLVLKIGFEERQLAYHS